MGIKTANDLFVSQLRDIYSAEKQAVRAYPKLAKAVRSEELKSALAEHLEQTEGQIERLHRAFDALGKKSSGRTCEAMKGLVKEAHEAIKEISRGPVLDAAIVAASQRIEHYEIASYGTVAAFAEATGATEIHALLGATLAEEKAADERLSDIAQGINAAFLPKAETEDDEETEAKPSRGRGGSKSAGKKAAGRAKRS